MRLARPPIELITLFYLVAYVPYIMISRALSTIPQPGIGRTLSGLEALPPVLILGSVLTVLFVWGAGWIKHANQVRVLGVGIPWPRWSTFLSGLGAALLLFTVPLSLTFRDVSIPFMQLIMRGDVLVIAPLVDIVFRRRVHWWSWAALVLVAAALAMTLQERGGFHLPPLAILTIGLYTLGYFIRLAVMTRVAKTGDENQVQGYFVEEKLVAMPVSILVLCAIAASPLAQGTDLSWGFVKVWSSGALPLIGLSSIAFFAVSVFSALILLDPRENTFCVPFERAASILAGVAGAYLLAIYFGQHYPTSAELWGSILLIAAVTLLSIAPRIFLKPDVKAEAKPA